MSVQVSYSKQFIFGFLLLLIFLGIVEGLVRIYEFDSKLCKWVDYDVFKGKKNLAQQICNDLNSIKYIYDDYFHTFTPNHNSPTFSTNSYGLRGEEFEREKPSDVFRIFIVGGSTAASMGATSNNSTIAVFLEQEFKDSSYPLTVQVIDAGVGGSFSFEETHFIKQILVEFQPDLIIAYDGGNDSRYRHLSDSPRYDKDFDIGNIKFSDFIFYRTPFVISSEIINPILLIDDKVKDKDAQLIAEKWKNRWKSSCDFGNSSGFETIVILQPTLATTSKTLTSDEEKIKNNTSDLILTKQIMQYMYDSFSELEQSCNGVIDLRDVFDIYDEPIFFDDIHVSDLGNKIVAKQIFSHVVPIIEKYDSLN